MGTRGEDGVRDNKLFGKYRIVSGKVVEYIS